MSAPGSGPFAQQVTFLATRDLAATTSFYETVLELPLILDQGSCRIYRVSASGFLGFCERETAPERPEGASGFLGFCERETAPERPEGVIITLVSADVDGWADRLRSRGVVFEKPPQHNPRYNIYHCFLRDPNGYLLEIQTFLDPAWPPATR